MTELICMLSTGKGTWSDVARLIASHQWDRIFLITDQFGTTTFQKRDNTEFVVINNNDPVEKIHQDIVKQLKDKIGGPEVALNFVSGTGKEHMALLSAVLKLGLGIRLVAYENSLKEL